MWKRSCYKEWKDIMMHLQIARRGDMKHLLSRLARWPMYTRRPCSFTPKGGHGSSTSNGQLKKPRIGANSRGRELRPLALLYVFVDKLFLANLEKANLRYDQPPS